MVVALAAAGVAGTGAGADTSRPGVTERLSVSSAGAPGNDHSGGGEAAIAVTPDGRYVAFPSDASNLVAGDINRQADIFVRDRRTGRTAIASVPTPGTVAQAGGTGMFGARPAKDPAISANGRYVAFSTCRVLDGKASTVDLGSIVWVHDSVAGTTTRVSVSYDGKPMLGSSIRPSISDDGRYIAFQSAASGVTA